MQQNYRTIEEIASLTIANGSNGNSIRVTPPDGFVARVVAHYGDLNNTGFVNAQLKDTNGLEIVKLQSIASLRSRNVAFEHDGKPVHMKTNNRTFIFEVVSDQAFTNDTNVQLVFVFVPENKDCPTLE